MLHAERWGPPWRERTRLAGRRRGRPAGSRQVPGPADPALRTMTRADVNAYVEGRLSGTVWASSIAAKTVYGRCMRAGQTLGGLAVWQKALAYGSLAIYSVAGGAAALGYRFWAACCLILSGVCDVLDGMVARATGHVTKFGAILDSTVDRLSDPM